MADRSIHISWGRNPSGRETMGLGVFQAAVQYSAGLEKNGKIESFRLGIARQGNISTHAGFMLMEGSQEQIRDVLDDSAFQDLVIKASHCVEDLRVVECVAGDGVPARIERLVAVRSELGID